MSNLIPRFFKAGKIIYNELECICELNFLEHGSLAIGFEVNKTKKFHKFIGKGSTFGCYNCLFNKKSYFIWQCVDKIEGFAIKKRDWFKMAAEDEHLCNILKKKIA
jgi:hypothetical protein